MTVGSVPVMPDDALDDVVDDDHPDRARVLDVLRLAGRTAHVPRSTRAIFPETAAAFVIALQPSVVERRPRASLASVAATTGAVTETDASRRPEVRRPTA